jgi:hypothetical protein
MLYPESVIKSKIQVTINLNPDTEARLVALAQESGLTVELFLEHLVKEKKSTTAPRRHLNPDDWSAQFEEWANSFPEAPLISDEALRRESLYPDR